MAKIYKILYIFVMTFFDDRFSGLNNDRVIADLLDTIFKTNSNIKEYVIDSEHWNEGVVAHSPIMQFDGFGRCIVHVRECIVHDYERPYSYIHIMDTDDNRNTYNWLDFLVEHTVPCRKCLTDADIPLRKVDDMYMAYLDAMAEGLEPLVERFIGTHWLHIIASDPVKYTTAWYTDKEIKAICKEINCTRTIFTSDIIRAYSKLIIG